MKLSMKDIAKLSGFSLKTVSRVLNNSPEVKKETREKVLNIVNEYGFRRNIIAKSLKGKKTNTIIVFIDRHSGEYWGIWHTTILSKIMTVAKRLKYKIIISPSSSDSNMVDETDGFVFLTSGLADGAILMDNKLEDSRIEFLIRHKIPHVILGNCSNYEKSHWIDLNNYNAGYMGGKYLVEKGYERIAFLVGDDSFKVNQERSKGFEKAMKDLKNETNEVISGITSMEKTYECIKDRIKCGKKTDAYFISGDERAIGAYRAIQESGFIIPTDIAILGIDNIPHSKYLYPSLSSINQPADGFAEQIIMLLDQLIENNNKDNSNENGVKKVTDNILLPYNLIEREST